MLVTYDDVSTGKQLFLGFLMP